MDIEQKTAARHKLGVLGRFLFVCTISLLLALMLLSEIIALIPLPRPFYIFSGLCLIAVTWMATEPKLKRPRKFLIWTVCIALLLLMLIVYQIEFSSREPFLCDLNRVEIGMTREQVDVIMGDYMRGTGWPANPFNDGTTTGTLTEAGTGLTMETGSSANGEMTITGAEVFRHSNDGRFNADWGVVHYKDGRVSLVEFMPD